MATIYDGTFRTILNDCRKLIIPVINEIFGETYTGKEEIRFFPNEHFLLLFRQDFAFTAKSVKKRTAAM